MRSNELRVGNYVSLSGSIILKVYEINKDCFYAQDEDESSFKSSWADLHPIPLSEEILLKCGFEKVEIEIDDYYDCSYEKQLSSDVFISYSYDFSCALYWNKEKSKHDSGVLPNWHSTDTVHGLQNLYFALTGEELDIKL